MKESDANEPILYSQIEDQYSNLLKKKRIFDASINEIIQLMDHINFEESSNITLIRAKFENIKMQMNKIKKGINALSNIIPDEDIPTTIKLNTLSDSISSKYKRANTNFQNIFNNADKYFDEQLSLNSDISTCEKSSEGVGAPTPNTVNNQMVTQNPLINNNKIEKLKKVKKEYEHIYDITNSLSKLSEDIKVNALNQDNQIELISNNMEIIDGNLNKGNEELKKYKEENSTDNSSYYKYIGFIFILIIFFAILIYYKLNATNTTPSNEKIEPNKNL